MRKIPALVFLVLVAVIGNAQPAKKTVAKEKAPTSKEMADMMKEAQQMMTEMDPEAKKMMDSMGIKMPSIKDMPKMTDKDLADAYAMEGIVVPPKNIKLIATIPKKILSPSELLNYTKTTTSSIAAVIKPEAIKLADKLIELFKTDTYYGALIASAANGMWMNGYKEAGIYLMGKAIEVLPNADNYNNYAAYLTMMGAAHMAIPVLDKLNSVHKKNTTILNNLAQAWLQLGDEEKANRYLDSTIMIYAYHPQANYTKCLMLESKGKRAEATTALHRSLKHSVTKTKLDKLKQLEKDKPYPPKGYRVPKVYYSSTFNLGLYTAMIPSTYATTMGKSAENEWINFRKQIREEKEKIDAGIKLTDKVMEQDVKNISAQGIRQKGLVFPPYYHQAILRYSSYEEQEGMRDTKKYVEDGVKYLQGWINLKTAFEKELSEEQERFEKESKNGDNYYNCDKEMPIITKYVTEINNLNSTYNEKIVNQLTTSSYQRYYYMTAIAISDAGALNVVLKLKSNFLQKLLELKHEAYTNINDCLKEEKEKPYKEKELPDYDEVNCNILNTINWPGWGSIVMRCNNMSLTINSSLLPVKGSLTANFDGYVEQASIGVKLKGVDLEVGAKFDKDGKFVEGNGSISTTIKGIEVTAEGKVNEDGFEKGSIELGIDGELKFLPEALESEAPVEIGLKGELGVGMEISGEGNTDFYVKQKTEGTIASNIETDSQVELTPGMISADGTVTEPEKMNLPLPDAPSVSVSAENRWSVNSGFSVTKGSLSGLNHK